MSHVVCIKSEVCDPAAIRAACVRLGLEEPREGTVELFSEVACGVVVRLVGWLYPIVCDTASGSLKFDNYQGRWGDQRQLNQFIQMYAVEKARIEARKKGHTVTEQSLANGSIKLTIQVAGATV